jgi:hypothetical protein
MLQGDILVSNSGLCQSTLSSICTFDNLTTYSSTSIIAMAHSAAFTDVALWPKQPFLVTQDPPGIFFLHDIPALRSFFKWIAKQSLDGIAPGNRLGFVKGLMRAARWARFISIDRPDSLSYAIPKSS